MELVRYPFVSSEVETPCVGLSTALKAKGMGLQG